MARELTRWGAALAIACVAVAAGYLPPHGGDARPAGQMPPEPGVARARANALADQWRAVARALQIARYRAALDPVLSARADASGPTVALLADAPDSLRLRAESLLTPRIEAAWRRLGLGTTKVRVGVVVDLRQNQSSTAAPAEEESRLTYVLPDSTDRTTCLAIVPSRWYRFALTHPDQHLDPGVLDRWLGPSLGPCAFYARFGTPGRQIRQWLAARRYDLALKPSWNGDSGRGDAFLYYLTADRQPPTANAARHWNWGGFFELQPDARACFSGRAAACRRAIAEGDDAGGIGTSGTIVTPENPWALNLQSFLGGNHFLADVAARAGTNRFLDFWTTTLPVDSALSLALREPVDAWTVGLARQLSPAPPLGPALRPLDLVLGLLLAGILFAAIAYGAERRTVR
ncbi:MAG: hypothetical protein ACHQXA_00180 [Gemmatimonadales bacterium]